MGAVLMIDSYRIQKRIFDLYAEREYSESEIKDILEKYSDRAKIWEESLQKYSTEEILRVIDEYWRFKNSEVKPRLAHIQAMLNTQKVEEYEINDRREEQEKLARQAEKTKEELRRKMLEKWGV